MVYFGVSNSIRQEGETRISLKFLSKLLELFTTGFFGHPCMNESSL